MISELWKMLAEAVTDAELAEFRRQICLRGGHVGVAAIGVCDRCSGATASRSMSICKSCAKELGVCPFDQRMTGWGTVAAGEGEAHAVRWLALLMRGYSTERAAARRALGGWPEPELVAAAADVSDPPDPLALGRSPVVAEFTLGFTGGLPQDLDAWARGLDAQVIRSDAALGHALVRTANAARLEALLKGDAGVRFVELNRDVAEIEA